MRGNTNACISSSGSAGGGGDEIEVINNTGKTVEAGEKVWVNILSGNSDGAVVGDNNFGTNSNVWGFTKDGQYLLAGQILLKVYSNNTFTGLMSFSRYAQYIKHENGKTFGIHVSNGMTACANYPNTWETDFMYINDGYFVHHNSTEIRKYDLETGEVIKRYTGDNTTYPSQNVVIDNVMYYLSYERRKYTFNDENNTYSYQDYVVTIKNRDNKEIGVFLGKTSDGKYYVDSNLNLITYLGNDTFEVLSNEKMPAILQRWNGIEKTVRFNQDTGVLIVDSDSEYGIYKYDNGEWQKLNYELNLTGEGTRKKGLIVNYDLTQYAFPTNNYRDNQVNIGTMQPNLKVMAQEFRWFNVNEQSITGVAKENAEPDAKFKVSTMLGSEIDVTVTTNADNAEISMEL